MAEESTKGIEHYISHIQALSEEDRAKLPGPRSMEEILDEIRKTKDPKRKDELFADLYEAMDEYSMDRSEQAWAESEESEGTVESGPDETGKKAYLSPRNLPPDESPEGIRQAEEDLVRRLSALIDRAITAMRRRRGASVHQLGPTLGDIMAELRAEFLREGMGAVRQLYGIGFRAERPMAPFGGAQEAAIRYLQEHPDELAGQLSRVVADETGILAKVIRESFAAGVDTAGAIDKATEELNESRWKVERVVRSATTSIVNKARISEIEARGPGELVDVIVSHDERTCPVCLEAETHNPWTTADLRTRTKGRMTFHSGCRCTVGRHVE